MKIIYLRLLRYEEAKNLLHQELNKAFMEGFQEVEVIHGIGTGTLRKMVINEVNSLDYAEIHKEPGLNPGSIRIKLFPPSSENLKKWITSEKK